MDYSIGSTGEDKADSRRKPKRTKMGQVWPIKRDGGLTESSFIRNNSRVSLTTDPVTRRRVQDIQPLAYTMLVEVPAVRCQTRTSITRHSCKGVLLHEGVPFYILLLFGAQRQPAKDDDENTRQEKVWVYVQDRGVIQVLWEDIQERIEGFIPDRVCAKASYCGNVRLVPQKIGTRANSDTKMALCFRLDFGVGSETNRWLWVEDSLLLGVHQTMATTTKRDDEEKEDKYKDEILVAEILATLATTIQKTKL